MSESREIMYVGSKPEKRDNVNQSIDAKARVWNGLGDVQNVSPLEAINLCKHSQIWVDVTHWDTEKRNLTVHEIREKMRAAARSANALNATIGTASIEELELELERRRNQGTVRSPARASADVSPTKPTEVIDQHDGAPVSRPASSADVVAAIVGAIMTLDVDKPELWDKDGNATQEAVEQALGYKVSKSELKAGNTEASK